MRKQGQVRPAISTAPFAVCPSQRRGVGRWRRCSVAARRTREASAACVQPTAVTSIQVASAPSQVSRTLKRALSDAVDERLARRLSRRFTRLRRDGKRGGIGDVDQGRPPLRKSIDDDPVTEARERVRQMAKDVEQNRSLIARTRALIQGLTDLLAGKSKP